ncbi:MAG TPA: hypothetical protein VNZ25_02180 [Candidatus Angelobacter sp.]|nr:hypothetical protein [Candidatus Angelobacter sp.]
MNTTPVKTHRYALAILLLIAGSHPPLSHANPPAGPVCPVADQSSLNAPAAATSYPITWKTPAGWTEVPATEMRVASFKVNQNGQQAEISVVPLGGMAGGDPANVNRWRGQVGLPALTPDALQKTLEFIQIDGQPAALFDVAGTNPGSGDVSRIIAAIQHRDDSTWFFKMTGDGGLVAKQKAAFRELLKSITFSAIAPVLAQMPATLPPGHPDISGSANSPANPAAPISHEGQPAWQVPSGWQEIACGQFLVAKFLLSGAAVNVSRSAGDGGGLAANVNRWRGQIGLPPVDNISGLPISVKNGIAVQVDLTGASAQTGQPARVVGVQVAQPGQTWFYKLMGDPAVVAGQKDAFIHFVQGINY